MMLFAVKEEMNYWMVALASQIYLSNYNFCTSLSCSVPFFLLSFDISLILFLNAPPPPVPKSNFLSLFLSKKKNL